MKPIKFIRPDDGEVFSLNDDGITYSLQKMKDEFPNHLHTKYTKELLIDLSFTPMYKN